MIAVVAVEPRARQRDHPVIRHVHSLHGRVVVQIDLARRDGRSRRRVGLEDPNRPVGRRLLRRDGQRRVIEKEAAVRVQPRRYEQPRTVVFDRVELVDVEFLRVGARIAVALCRRTGRQSDRLVAADRRESGLDRSLEVGGIRDFRQKPLIRPRRRFHRGPGSAAGGERSQRDAKNQPFH